MKQRAFSLLLILFLCTKPSIGTSEDLPELPQGPLLLTSVRSEQLSPEYWIERLPDPHKLLKTPEQLQKFNEDIHLAIKDRVDIFKIDPKWPGQPIRKQLEKEYKTLKKRTLYRVSGETISNELFEEKIYPQMQWSKIPKRISLKWGVATRATSVRALPTSTKMLEDIGDVEFDQLQFTLIKLWTPVAVFHTSEDGKWVYLQAPYTRGWVRASDIALFETREEIQKYLNSKNFLVVTGESVPFYIDETLQEAGFPISMGTVLPFKEKSPGYYKIWLPLRKAGGTAWVREAYVPQNVDVSEGFLPYTQANVIRQAFKLLGARYGWGGSYHGRDCSGFTHDVFLSFGVDLPRNSKDQGYIGTQLNHFEPFEQDENKKITLQVAMPGLTLLRMPTHQMLYLGQDNGQFYVIHATWAERISMTTDKKRRINQVVVSDLNLNANSYLGGLFERIVSVNEIK